MFRVWSYSAELRVKLAPSRGPRRKGYLASCFPASLRIGDRYNEHRLYVSCPLHRSQCGGQCPNSRVFLSLCTGYIFLSIFFCSCTCSGRNEAVSNRAEIAVSLPFTCFQYYLLWYKHDTNVQRALVTVAARLFNKISDQWNYHYHRLRTTLLSNRMCYSWQ